jgi:hypothetical protein
MTLKLFLICIIRLNDFIWKKQKIKRGKQMKKIFFWGIFLTILFVFKVWCWDSPFSLSKFQSVLQKAKFQAPESSFSPRWSCKYGKFKYFSNRYFYLQDGKYMVFEMCGKKKRSELRFYNEWRVSTSKPCILRAKVMLFPLDAKREFTFLQIHANGKRADKYGKKLNKPLLRVVWKKSFKHKKNHLWAVIRSSVKENAKYLKIDLGKRPEDFFTVKIEVELSHLKVWVEGSLKVDLDVSYWKQCWNYFKAGVYLQDDGCAKVLFEKIEVND